MGNTTPSGTQGSTQESHLVQGTRWDARDRTRVGGVQGEYAITPAFKIIMFFKNMLAYVGNIYHYEACTIIYIFMVLEK